MAELEKELEKELDAFFEIYDEFDSRLNMRLRKTSDPLAQRNRIVLFDIFLKQAVIR